MHEAYTLRYERHYQNCQFLYYIYSTIAKIAARQVIFLSQLSNRAYKFRDGPLTPCYIYFKQNKIHFLGTQTI